MARKMFFKCLIVCATFLCYVVCFNFDQENVELVYNDDAKGSYFGYSLLLQKGNPSAVIVGAPKQNSSDKNGGSVYRCELSSQKSCEKYSTLVSSAMSMNGNCLGISMDGDDYVDGIFTACAPRVVKLRHYMNYFTSGQCVWKQNSSKTDSGLHIIDPLANDPPTSVYDNTPFYDYGFAQAGMDVSYIKSRKEIVLGAPGIKNWNGAVVTLNLQDFSRSILPNKRGPVFEENDNYNGYTVTTGHFEQTRRVIWYIAGAPRAERLKGKVTIFSYDVSSAEKVRQTATFKGVQTGSYFGGAILACDVTNDGVDDLIIGAPTAKGLTWDEGYVEFFRVAERKFETGITITGSKRRGSRFGSAIASLGDIDLDSYNDIAISAPYEDDGIGAVYIYMGSPNGIKTKHHQRLTPLKMNINVPVRGFGLGLSSGNDINDDGHNDIAIGAYLTDQIFIVKAKAIVDCNINVFFTNTTSMESISFQYCILYTERSKKRHWKSLQFQMELELDHRSKEAGVIRRDVSVNANELFCLNQKVTLKPEVMDISPFKITMKVDLKNNDFVIVEGEKIKSYSIPYVDGCGDDSICKTDIQVIATADSISSIVLGQTKDLTVTVSVNNSLEPAYQPELFVEVPKILELRNIRDCTFNNFTYICPLADKLTSPIAKEFIFDLKSTDVEMRTLTLKFEVKSLGENIGNQNKTILEFPIYVINTPYVVGKADPGNLAHNAENVMLKHIFSVGNAGPSPLRFSMNFKIPKMSVNGENVFEILETKSKYNNEIESSCYPSNKSVQEDDYSSRNEEMPFITTPNTRTVVLSCFEDGVECIQYVCNEERLDRLSETIVYEIRIMAKLDLLGKKYKELFKTKDIVAFITSAVLNNSTNTIHANSVTLIFGSAESKVPILIYIGGIVTGLVLLIILTFILYKCHFFNRIYKDKLNEELLLDKGMSEGTSQGNLESEKSDLSDEEPHQLKDMKLEM